MPLADHRPSTPVGYQTIDAPAAGHYKALAVQFENIGETKEIPIASLVTVGTPKGAPTATVAADQIWLWDSASANWVKYFYRLIGKMWCKAGETVETTDVVKNGDTLFFYRGTGGVATTLTLAGGVGELTGKLVQSDLVAGQYRCMAYPWPMAMKIASFKNYQGSPKGAPTATVAADQIWRWDTEASNWVKYFYRLIGTKWCKAGETTETTDTIPAGEGFFFYRGTGGVTDTVTFTNAAE